MFPAARVGDPITHDLLAPAGVVGPPLAPVPEGPVLIEGLPAAYVTCTTVCAGTTSAGPAHPPPPGPPPPIVKGSATVFIHHQPAARWSPAPDLGACGVFLGNASMAASRTVLIGDTGLGGASATLGATASEALGEQARSAWDAATEQTPQARALTEAAEAGAPLVERCPEPSSG